MQFLKSCNINKTKLLNWLNMFIMTFNGCKLAKNKSIDF